MNLEQEREKIIQLLNSSDLANQKIAFEILKGDTVFAKDIVCKEIIFSLLFASYRVLCTPQNKFAGYSCDECLTSGGVQCLLNKSFDTGICCDPKNSVSNDCKNQHK